MEGEPREGKINIIAAKDDFLKLTGRFSFILICLER